MNRFFRLLQPTIVQASDEMPNPELRGSTITHRVISIEKESTYDDLKTRFEKIGYTCK